MKKNHNNLKLADLGASSGSGTALNRIIVEKLKKLSSLLKQQDSKCWKIGDVCIDLLDNWGLSLGEISQRVNYSKTRISHFHLTARIFGADQRKGYTFQDSLTARQVYLGLPRLNMTPVQIRNKIAKMRGKTTKQVRSYFVHLLMKREMNRSLAKSRKYQPKVTGKLINTCHHADYQSIIPKLRPNCVTVFACDPPFGHKEYIPGNYLSYRTKVGGMRTDCDNSSAEDALAATLPLFELCLPKLAPGGVLILFQLGGRPDRIEVLQEAQKQGWEAAYGLSWNKGSMSTGNFVNPYRICTERILVFCREGERVKKGQNGMPVSNLLNFSTETSGIGIKMGRGKIKYGDYHLFQKPSTLMEFLVSHHSYPNDLVVSPFGCSGVDVIAAHKLGRRWVYIESNKNNFLYGSGRIAQAIENQSTKVG